jgi:hypothetical protein
MAEKLVIELDAGEGDARHGPVPLKASGAPRPRQSWISPRSYDAAPTDAAPRTRRTVPRASILATAHLSISSPLPSPEAP